MPSSEGVGHIIRRQSRRRTLILHLLLISCRWEGLQIPNGYQAALPQHQP